MATHLEEASRLDGSDGTYRADFPEDWKGPHSIYGGLLAATVIRAAGRASEIPRIASVSCHYLGPIAPGPVDVAVTSLHRTRRLESLRVSLSQDGRVGTEALALMLAPGEGYAYQYVAPPEAPAPEGLRTKVDIWRNDEGRAPSNVWARVETRPVGWTPIAERTGGDPRILWWLRAADTPDFEGAIGAAACTACVADNVFHDPVFMVQGGDPAELPFGAPTVDLQVHFHRPAPGPEWLLCESRSDVAVDGLVSGSAVFWTRDGALAASARSTLACRTSHRPTWAGAT